MGRITFSICCILLLGTNSPFLFAQDCEYLLGVTVESVNNECVVRGFDPLGPCSRLSQKAITNAVIENGDVILAVNGRKVRDVVTLRRAMNTSPDGKTMLYIRNRSDGKASVWFTQANRDPQYQAKPQVLAANRAVHKYLEEQLLHPSFVPMGEFTARQLNPVLVGMLWNECMPQVNQILQRELGIPQVNLGYRLSPIPGSNPKRYKIIFNRTDNPLLQEAIRKIFAMEDDQFLKYVLVQRSEVKSTSSFLPQFRPSGPLDLPLVRQGMEIGFQSPASWVKRLNLAMSYESNNDRAYSMSQWRKATVGSEPESGVGGYYWQLHAGVIRVPNQVDQWSVGSTIVIGVLPYGESDPLRIRPKTTSDKQQDLAARLKAQISKDKGLQTTMIDSLKVEENTTLVVEDPLKVEITEGTILKIGQDIFEELKATLLIR